MKQIELDGIISERIGQAKDRQILRKAESVAKQLGCITRWYDGDSYEPDYPIGWHFSGNGLNIGDEKGFYGWKIVVQDSGKNVFTAFYHPAGALDEKIYGYIPGAWEDRLYFLYENIGIMMPKFSPEAYRIDMPNAGQRRITGSIEQIAMDNWEIDIRGEIKCQ